MVRATVVGVLCWGVSIGISIQCTHAEHIKGPKTILKYSRADSRGSTGCIVRQRTMRWSPVLSGLYLVTERFDGGFVSEAGE